MNAAGVLVRQRRQELGLTMDQLAATIWNTSGGAWNPDRRDLYRVERGTRKITDLEILLFARALDVAPASLLDPAAQVSALAPDQPRIVPRRPKSSAQAPKPPDPTD